MSDSKKLTENIIRILSRNLGNRLTEDLIPGLAANIADAARQAAAPAAPAAPAAKVQEGS